MNQNREWVDVSQLNRDKLLELALEKRVYLEGNILKILSAPASDTEFNSYLAECINKDMTSRKKRLEVTKQVQKQYRDLQLASDRNSELMESLQSALAEAKASEQHAQEARKQAENAKDIALHDLEVLQKKKQFELIGLIIKTALGIIGGVAVLTTLMYVYVLAIGADTQIVGSAWSNLFGILLTNAFSIVGTIMGVKYATEKTQEP